MNFNNKNIRSWGAIILCLVCCYGLTTATYAKSSKDEKQLKEKMGQVEKLAPSPAKTHFYQENELNSKQKLPTSITNLLKKYKIPQDNLSIYVRDLYSSKPLLEHNADKLRNPASTMKLLTTFAALKKLGPNYSWRTEIWLRGELKEGVLAGDLIIKGYGDPFLIYENFWKLVKTLRDKGLKEIQGDIIIDNSYFSLPAYDPAAFDGKPFRVYNAQVSALMFNFQATRFLFRPVLNKSKEKQTTKKSQKGKNKKYKNQNKASYSHIDIIPLPKIIGFDFDNQIKLSKGKCRKSHYKPKFSKDKSGKLIIKGSYAANCKQQFILRSVSTPEEHAFNAFRDFWTDLHGVLKGHLKVGRVQSGDKRFHVYSSPSLGQQIRLINKWSNNVMTRQLLLTLGAKHFGAPATPEKGRRAILQILAQNNIDTTGIQMENGSGLSRTAKISARQMGSLLETAYRDAYMPEFIASLSLPGIDGTMVNRFRNEDLRGRSHLKTGTLNFVTAIAGYMLNRSGKRLVVVIQHNGKKTGGGRGSKIQNALLRWSFEQ